MDLEKEGAGYFQKLVLLIATVDSWQSLFKLTLLFALCCRRRRFSSHYPGCGLEWDHRADPLPHPRSSLHWSRGLAGYHRQGNGKAFTPPAILSLKSRFPHTVLILVWLLYFQGWCGWKGPDFWDQTAYYNLCLPQRPKVIWAPSAFQMDLVSVNHVQKYGGAL